MNLIIVLEVIYVLSSVICALTYILAPEEHKPKNVFEGILLGSIPILNTLFVIYIATRMFRENWKVK